MDEKRSFILIFDMLAGHWDEKACVPTIQLPYPNVMSYAKKNILPTFKECIESGIFVYAWNKGICNTPYGQKYLASGTYEVKAERSIDPYWKFIKGIYTPTILSACKRQYPGYKIGSFGSDAWMQTGWWKASEATFGWGSYYSDFLTMQHCFKWMRENPDWKMVLLYLSQYDMTGNVPVFKEKAAYTEDKYHSIIQLDRYLWMITTFLQETNWWKETYLSIGSDHGCHCGCNVAVEEALNRGIPPAKIPNYCSNHQEPHDCYIWNFKKNEITGERIDGCRRITFIISGGALPASSRGKIIDDGEIIDFSPTIAKFLEIDFSSDGKSVI